MSGGEMNYPCNEFSAWTDDDPCDICGFDRLHHAGQERARALRSRVHLPSNLRPGGLSRRNVSESAVEYQENRRRRDEAQRQERDQQNLRHLNEAMRASRHINEDPETCAHQDHVEIPTPGPRTNAMCSYCGAILVKLIDAETGEELVAPEDEERAIRIVQIYHQAIEGGGTRVELYRRFQRVYGPPTSPVEVWNA